MKTGNPLVVVPDVIPPRMYSREEARFIEGIFMDPNTPKIRFVSNGQGEIFIIGDGCLIYKPRFQNLTNKSLIKVNETITFIAD